MTIKNRPIQIRPETAAARENKEQRDKLISSQLMRMTRETGQRIAEQAGKLENTRCNRLGRNARLLSNRDPFADALEILYKIGRLYHLNDVTHTNNLPELMADWRAKNRKIKVETWIPHDS